MKKIISLVCVIAMLFAFAVTVNAAGTSFTLELEEQTATSATYVLYLDTDVDLAAFGIAYDMSDAIANKGIADEDITVTAELANVTAKYVPKQDLISIKRADTSGSTVTGQQKVVTIVINTTNMTDAFDFVQASGSAAKNFAVTEATADGAVNITANVAFPTATVEMFKAAFEAETVKGEAIEASATEVVLPKSEGSLNTNTYKNVAVFNATLGADVKYGEAGFIWVANGTETANAYKVDASVIAGGGTFEYGVVMAGIPSDVTITAIPYYVTAE